ncbi:hypothetical protein [Sphingomonas hengshuiensis]|uniref:DUF2178 domain-containing protein n=1 Tax=Sphingomonas hengshuiensis TaxID=1609977 RepID=A0A7U4LFQ4_9SPHN|nr:hypothetical protein [Sphingomonas hengshuiensis]AJP72759.1 hypothetical protein TS85_14720 [Sphingomonas hengshuiensis]
MSFKEKIAWISLVTTVLVWGGFYGFMLATYGRYPGAVYFTGFFAAVTAQAVLAAGAAIVTALLAPRDATAAADERDKAIARRAYTIAYPILLVLLLGVVASIHLGANPVQMAYAIIAAIVVAEIVHYGAQIAGYRRGY